MNIIAWVVMIWMFFFGLSTLSKAYPNYYMYIAIFTLAYLFFLKVNETLVNYKNIKQVEDVSGGEPSSFWKVLTCINEFSTFMHVANYICIIGVISGWNLLMQGNDYVGLMFIVLATCVPLGIMLAENKLD